MIVMDQDDYRLGKSDERQLVTVFLLREFERLREADVGTVRRSVVLDMAMAIANGGHDKRRRKRSHKDKSPVPK